MLSAVSEVQLIALCIGKRHSVLPSSESERAVIDRVDGPQAREAGDVGVGGVVEEFFVDEGRAGAEVEGEFVILPKVVADADAGGGAEGDGLDGVVEFMIFTEGIPAFGFVPLGEGAAVDGIEVELAGGLGAVGLVVDAADFDVEFLGVWPCS